MVRREQSHCQTGAALTVRPLFFRPATWCACGTSSQGIMMPISAGRQPELRQAQSNCSAAWGPVRPAQEKNATAPRKACLQ